MNENRRSFIEPIVPHGTVGPRAWFSFWSRSLRTESNLRLLWLLLLLVSMRCDATPSRFWKEDGPPTHPAAVVQPHRTNHRGVVSSSRSAIRNANVAGVFGVVWRGVRAFVASRDAFRVGTQQQRRHTTPRNTTRVDVPTQRECSSIHNRGTNAISYKTQTRMYKVNRFVVI